MKRCLFFCFFVSIFCSFPAAFKRLTCGFKLAKMRLEQPFRSDWVVEGEIPCAILEQPFTYLDRGAQCYVFASQDDKYVVKLFRYDQRQKVDTQEKIEHLFKACTLAYNKAREETGLIFLHLNCTEGELPILHATGPIGQSLRIPLDRYRFAIQKKATPFGKAMCDAESPEAMQKLINAFLATLRSRIDKGLRNSDPAIGRNFGFLDGRAIEIDFGNYSENGIPEEEEMQMYLRRLQTWLGKHSGRLAEKSARRIVDF